MDGMISLDTSGCVDMLGMSYTLGNLELSPPRRKGGMVMSIVPLSLFESIWLSGFPLCLPVDEELIPGDLADWILQRKQKT